MQAAFDIETFKGDSKRGWAPGVRRCCWGWFSRRRYWRWRPWPMQTPLIPRGSPASGMMTTSMMWWGTSHRRRDGSPPPSPAISDPL